MSQAVSFVIDDLKADFPESAIGSNWQFFTDQVMGGVSNGRMVKEIVAGRAAIHMQGDVSLENNGGFIQVSLDLAATDKVFDAGAWKGIEIEVYGSVAEYELRLRTAGLSRPWQSYRQVFKTFPEWKTIQLPFSLFTPHRTKLPLNIQLLRRLGLVAIGKSFTADLALSSIRLFT